MNQEIKIGRILKKSIGYCDIFKNAAGDIITKSLDGGVIERYYNFKVGDRVHQGKIIEVGDKVAVIEVDGKPVPMFKSQLLRIPDPEPINTTAFNKAFLSGLFKRKSATAREGTTGSPAVAGEKQSIGGIRWNVKGGQRPGHKYIERKPNPKDPDKYIYLYELPGGKREWRDEGGQAVEEAKEARIFRNDKVKWQGKDWVVGEVGDNYVGLTNDKDGKQFVAKTELEVIKAKGQVEPPAKEKKLVPYQGKDWEIVEEGEAYHLIRDVKTGAIRIAPRREIEKEKEKMGARVGKKKEEVRAADEALGESREEASARDRSLGEAVKNPKYSEWRTHLSGEGSEWKQDTDFQASKSTKGWKGEDVELQQFYDVESHTIHGLVDGQEVLVKYGGKDHAVLDIDASKNTVLLLDKDRGDTVPISRDDLDMFVGRLHIDEDGEISVIQDDKIKGKLVFEEGIKREDIEWGEGVTQKDLFDSDTIKVIKDTVYKKVRNLGEGAKYRNIKLGTIDRGMVGYEGEEFVGIVNKYMKKVLAKKRDVATSIGDDKLTAREKELKTELKMLKELQKKHNEKMQNANTVKARTDIGKTEIKTFIPTKKKQFSGDYKEVFNAYVDNAGNGFEHQLVYDYGNSSWKATIANLAEQLKVRDIQKNEQAQSFNEMSGDGENVPKIEHSNDEYIDLASDLLRDHRNQFLKKQKAEKQSAYQSEGDVPSAFDWGDTSDIPVGTAKAYSQEPSYLRDSKGNKYEFHYVIVPKKSVISSNDITGAVNPLHPTELQARSRTDLRSIQQMKNISKNVDTNLVESSPDATSGSPIAFSRDGKIFVAQGNGRATGIQNTEGDQKEKYFDLMKNQAEKFGLDTSKIDENDMLIRVLSPKHTYEDARALASFGQEANALPPTELEKARGIRNAQRNPITYSVNLEGVGTKPIDATNVTAFIRANPEMYKQIVQGSGYEATAIEGSPEEQARLINTAMLTQLKPRFINEMSGRDEKTHNFVKRIAPSLMDNQRLVGEGKLPKQADIQNIISVTAKIYDGLDASTKSLLGVDKNGNIPFLEEDEKTALQNSLLHRLRQEDLMSESTGKEENVYRNPMNVIAMIAYHQAMNPRLKEEGTNRGLNTLALKFRRFTDALKTVGEGSGQEDVFGATQTPEEKQAELQDRIVSIAEKTLLENKSFNPDEQLSAEEKELAGEAGTKYDVGKRMAKMAQQYGIKLAKSNVIIKALLGWNTERNFRRAQESRFEQIADVREYLMKSNAEKIIAVDFDGVIHKYSDGYKDGTIVNKKKILFKGNQINIFGDTEKPTGATKQGAGGKRLTLKPSTKSPMKRRWQAEEEVEKPKKLSIKDREAKKIRKIIDIEDTREYELTIDDEGNEKGVAIAGSGREHNCDRCGKIHEVHATVEFEDGTHAIVGTSCMKAEDDQVAKIISSGANTVKSLRIAEMKLAKLEKHSKKFVEIVAEVETMKMPEPIITQGKGEGVNWISIGDKKEGLITDDDLNNPVAKKARMDLMISSWKRDQASELAKRANLSGDYEGYYYQHIKGTKKRIDQLERRVRAIKDDAQQQLNNRGTFDPEEKDITKSIDISPSIGLRWNIRGGTNPQHKYLERRPSKTDPNKYTYVYKMPSPRQPAQPEEGISQKQPTAPKQDFHVDDFIDLNGKRGQLKIVGDDYAVVRKADGQETVQALKQLKHWREMQPEAKADPIIDTIAESEGESLFVDGEGLQRVNFQLSANGKIAGTLIADYSKGKLNPLELEQQHGKEVVDLLEAVKMDDNIPFDARYSEYMDRIKRGNDDVKMLSASDQINKLKKCVVKPNSYQQVYGDSQKEVVNKLRELSKVYNKKVPAAMHEDFKEIINQIEDADRYQAMISQFLDAGDIKPYEAETEYSRNVVDDIYGVPDYKKVKAIVFGNKQSFDDPILIITGGLPASSKSTGLGDAISNFREIAVQIDPDEVKRVLAVVRNIPVDDVRKHPAKYHQDSAKISKALVRQAIRDKKNVVYDVTMKGEKNIADLLTVAKEHKYSTKGYFIHIEPEQSLERNISRGRMGKRTLSKDIWMQEFGGELPHKTYFGIKDQFDETGLVDNSQQFGEKPTLVMSKSEGKTTVHDQEKFEKIKGYASYKGMKMNKSMLSRLLMKLIKRKSPIPTSTNPMKDFSMANLMQGITNSAKKYLDPPKL